MIEVYPNGVLIGETFYPGARVENSFKFGVWGAVTGVAIKDIPGQPSDIVVEHERPYRTERELAAGRAAYEWITDVSLRPWSDLSEQDKDMWVRHALYISRVLKEEEAGGRVAPPASPEQVRETYLSHVQSTYAPWEEISDTERAAWDNAAGVARGDLEPVIPLPPMVEPPVGSVVRDSNPLGRPEAGEWRLESDDHMWRLTERGGTQYLHWVALRDHYGPLTLVSTPADDWLRRHPDVIEGIRRANASTEGDIEI